MTNALTETAGLKTFMTLDSVNLYKVGFSDIHGRKLEISRDDWGSLGHAQGITVKAEETA